MEELSDPSATDDNPTESEDDKHSPLEADALLGEAERENRNDLPAQADAAILPVVGLGGSAGAISALQEFFGRISTNLGVAYVVVIHLAADYESQLPQILQARTRMPVVQVQGSVKVEADHVYVIPPAHHLAMNDGHIHLSPPQQKRGQRVAVDLFFRTLASTHRSKAVAVVLSGADGDGAIGIKRIKEHGGLTIAQDPAEADHDSMPRAAIDTGMVDWILSVEQMTAKLGEWIDNEGKIHLPAPCEPEAPVQAASSTEDEDEVALHEVLSFLTTRTGHDFAHYKRATVIRRIQRRLQVNSLESVPQYAEFLRTHPGEAGALLQDLLISVTNFFRDPEAFRAVESNISRLFRGKGASDAVRVWVAGCATGEEAYSLAMLLLEYAETLDERPEIQIFATDLDDQALRMARDGAYPATIATDVSPERLRRFFVLEQGHYRVKKEVRERVLFASHNPLKDSPFSRLDLISCRNLLIYFGRAAQDRVLDVFHFALRSGGLLFLGGSESVGDSSLFGIEDKRHRIYARQNVARLPIPLPTLTLPTIPRIEDMPRLVHTVPAPPDAIRHADTPSISYGELHLQLLEQMAAPSILVNANYEIVHLSPHVGAFLRFAGGEMSTNLPSVIHPALRLELRSALFRAVHNGENVDVPTLTVDFDGEARRIQMRVRPLREGGRSNAISSFVLIIFDEEAPLAEMPPSALASDETARHLEDELEHLRSYLHTSVEQFEASAEELKASNEELQAMNEEQRSAAEELETSREEIQAANEELITLNHELKSKVEEVSRTNADLQNLMASTDIATVFLSRDLRINRYTPRAIEMFSLIPTDVGRPIADLRHRFADSSFIEDADAVLRTLALQEREVQTTDDQWYLLRVSPYRTIEDRIDGVVLTFVDITRRKVAENSLHQMTAELETQLRKFDSVISSVPDFIYTFDLEGRFTYMNKALFDLLQKAPETALGKNFHELNYPPELATRLQGQIQEVIASRQSWRDNTPFTSALGTRQYQYIFVPLFNERNEVEAVAGVSHDITDIKLGETNLRKSEERLRIAIESARMGTWDWNLLTNEVGWNKRHFTLLGMEPRSTPLNPQEFFQHLHLDDREWVRERLMNAAHNNVPFEAEFRVQPVGGEVRWMNGYGKTVETQNGQTSRMSGVMLDITERKQDEEASRQSEARFRAIVNQSTAGVAEMDLQGNHTLVNQRFCDMLGYSEAELLQINMRQITYPQDLPRGLALFAEAIQTGKPLLSEKRLIRKDGELIWINDSVSRINDTHGNALSAATIAIDITERKQAEAALSQSEEQIRIAVEGANLGTCDWHYASGEMHWNDQHFWMFGMQPREALTYDEFMERVHPDDRERLRVELRTGIEKVGVYEVEFRIVREDNGAVRWMNDAGRVVERNETGFPTRVGNVIFDVTARREAEEAVKSARDELEWRVEERTHDLGEALQQLRAEAAERAKVERARRDLLQRVVNSQEEERLRISRELHDNLGQHLTAVMLGLQALQNQSKFAGEERRATGSGFDNLRNLVDDLMKAAHRQAWELRPAELDDMGLEVALRHYISDWSERTAIPVDFQTIGWDEERLAPNLEITFYRVVQEALTNVARHADACNVSVILEINAGVSAIIEDDGHGFNEGEGNGRLGLLGMRERLALVGGTLEIESAPDSGTTIFARVPQNPDSPSDFPYLPSDAGQMAPHPQNTAELDRN